MLKVLFIANHHLDYHHRHRHHRRQRHNHNHHHCHHHWPTIAKLTFSDFFPMLVRTKYFQDGGHDRHIHALPCLRDV